MDHPDPWLYWRLGMSMVRCVEAIPSNNTNVSSVRDIQQYVLTQCLGKTEKKIRKNKIKNGRSKWLLDYWATVNRLVERRAHGGKVLDIIKLYYTLLNIVILSRRVLSIQQQENELKPKTILKKQTWQYLFMFVWLYTLVYEVSSICVTRSIV